MVQVFFEGFLLQASLIFALGAQNLYVLESGIRRHHRLAVSVTCFFCDFTIIMLGVMGMATLLKSYPQVKIISGVLGIGFMLYYGFVKLWNNEKQALGPDYLEDQASIGKSILKAMTFSVVNPHAYLDGIVLIGGYASKYPEMGQRVMVGLGASIYSLVWFLMLSNASSAVMPFLQNTRRLRFAVSVSGVVLIFLSFKLSVDVYGWFLEAWEADQAIVLK